MYLLSGRAGPAGDMGGGCCGGKCSKGDEIGGSSAHGGQRSGQGQQPLARVGRNGCHEEQRSVSLLYGHTTGRAACLDVSEDDTTEFSS